ncbi:MAG: FtsW/RodA/SpoVE family cell cycle protein [Prevotellaceae bacterium]|nr:FtsW/RodA/SpoVE family cell cycle protein [Prevotellaceae bacterium]
MSKSIIHNLFKGDKTIWMIFFFLCLISVTEVYSASSSLTYKGGAFWTPIIGHVGTIIGGTIAMVVMLNIPCKYYKLATPFLIILSLFMLVWVLCFGQSTNGAARWVSILGFHFQPSELAKGTVVLATAQILSGLQTEHGADKRAYRWIMGLTGLFALLIMMENLSTALLLCVTVLGMMFIGQVPRKQLLTLIGSVIGLGILILILIFAIGDDTKADDRQGPKTEQVAHEKPGIITRMFHRADTWKARIEDFGSKDVPPQDVDLDKDGQKAHAAIAIASSNVIGVGPGNSVERDFLSQAFSDFIYAIIIEEMGIEGAIFVAALYIFLLFRTGHIASQCENNFPAFLAMGYAILLVTQALFNMLVAVGLVPVTGQPLPLISRGGSSMLFNCLYLGAILSVSRTAKKRDTTKDDGTVQEATSTQPA